MFICLAVGMDDAYVIIDHAERSRSAENEWTINLVTTMVGAGSSTLMTTLTSVTAFSVAAITSTLEGIRIFSINTAVAIFLVWVTAVTIFSAWVVLSDRLTPPTRSDLSRSLKLRWQALWDFLTALGSCGKSGVYDAECAATPGKSPPAPEVNTSISNTTNGKSGVIGTHTEGWLTHRLRVLTKKFSELTTQNRYFQALVVLAAVILTGVTIYGWTELRFEHNTRTLLPDNSYLRKTLDAQYEYFPESRLQIQFIFTNQDFTQPKTQRAMMEQYKLVLISSAVAPNSTDFWLPTFLDFVRNNASAHLTTDGFVTSEHFMDNIRAFFSVEEHRIYLQDIMFSANTAGRVAATRFITWQVATPGDIDQEIFNMRALQSIGKDGTSVYCMMYQYFSRNDTIKKTGFQNIAYSLIAVMLVAIAFLLKHNAAYTILITVLVGLTDAQLIGLMAAFGMEYNSVTVVITQMAIGKETLCEASTNSSEKKHCKIKNCYKK